MSLNLSATDITSLNNAIKQIDADATSGNTDTNTLGGNISLGGTALEVINLHAGVTLNIVGNNKTLDGGGAQRGLFVYTGAVTINDLAINNMLAQGGNGRRTSWPARRRAPR
jgi:hypothetical protein